MQIDAAIVQASNAQLVPTWENELDLHAQGYELLAGVDEAGRGAWAGPLVAAAVIFPHLQEILDFGFWILESENYASASDSKEIIQNPKSKIQNPLDS